MAAVGLGGAETTNRLNPEGLDAVERRLAQERVNFGRRRSDVLDRWDAN